MKALLRIFGWNGVEGGLSLSSLIVWTLTGLAVGSALLLTVTLYTSFSRSLAVEFSDRVRTESEEATLQMEQELSDVRTRLKEIAGDNAIRVTMMLGVDYQLGERLAALQGRIPGARYFVSRLGDGRVFGPEIPERDKGRLRFLMEWAPYVGVVSEAPDGGFTISYSLPIARRTERLGTVACVYSFSGGRLRGEGVLRDDSRLLVRQGQRYRDLFTGRDVALEHLAPEDGWSPRAAEVRLEGVKGLLVSSGRYPELCYFAGLHPLQTARDSLLLSAVSVTGALLVACLAISILLGRRLARPLTELTARALTVADGRGERTVGDVGSRVAEVSQLSRALNTMLDNLWQAEEMTRYRELFEGVADAVIIHDAEGRILECNAQAPELVGLHRRRFLEHTVYTLVPVRSRHILRSAMEAAASKWSVQEFEIPFEAAQGRELVTEIRMRKIRYRDQGVLLSVVRDVTDRKKAEVELLVAKQEAEAANRAKSAFLATMSHEIRTPMNAVLGMADLLRESDLTSDQRGYVQIVRSSGELLLEIINDILDLSKIESGQIVLEKVRFDPEQLVSKIARIMHPIAAGKGVEIVPFVDREVPPLLLGDPTRLQQVLVNLVSNAVKFTECGMIEIVLGCRVDDDGRLWIEGAVEDTGIGIPEDKLETIFDSFTQADHSTTRRYGGTGLGLTITRRLVELMGGHVHVHSRLGEGSRFSFGIPVEVVEECRDDRRMNVDLAGRRICVLDDNPVAGRRLGTMLREWGAKVHLVVDQDAAAQSLREAKDSGREFDLLLLDGDLGTSDGFVVADKLRESIGAAVPRLVVMPLSIEPRCDPEIMRVFRVSACLSKPVTRRNLLEVLQYVFGSGDAPAAPRRRARDEPETPGRTARVLLAEDSENNRLLVEYYLRGQPYELICVPNGREAVEAFRRGNFDVVLMDIQMPVMDGLAATREIRTLERQANRPRVPVIALTANAFEHDRRQSREAGCTDYLSKPTRKADLLRTLARYVAEGGEDGRGDNGGGDNGAACPDNVTLGQAGNGGNGEGGGAVSGGDADGGPNRPRDAGRDDAHGKENG